MSSGIPTQNQPPKAPLIKPVVPTFEIPPLGMPGACDSSVSLAPNTVVIQPNIDSLTSLIGMTGFGTAASDS